MLRCSLTEICRPSFDLDSLTAVHKLRQLEMLKLTGIDAAQLMHEFQSTRELQNRYMNWNELGCRQTNLSVTGASAKIGDCHCYKSCSQWRERLL